MNSLEDRVAILERQVLALFAALDPANNRPTANIDPKTGDIKEPEPGLVPRGKYAGRKHGDVVTADPHHVVWLADNNKAYGLGYLDEHIEEARQLAKTTPEQKRGYTRR